MMSSSRWSNRDRNIGVNYAQVPVYNSLIAEQSYKNVLVLKTVVTIESGMIRPIVLVSL